MKNYLFLNRRPFLRTAGQTATGLAAASAFAPAVLSAPVPDRTIEMGCIGVGTRSGDLREAVVHAPNVKVAALADGYGPHRQKGVDRCLNPQAKACVNYRELLSQKMDIVQYLLGHGTPDTRVATYQFDRLGRMVTFAGCMNCADSLPVTLCGRDATLRFDDIAHNLSPSEIIPAGHNKKADLPRECARGKIPTQPNHMVDWVNRIQTRITPKRSTDEPFIETATFLGSLKSQPEKRMIRRIRPRKKLFGQN